MPVFVPSSVDFGVLTPGSTSSNGTLSQPLGANAQVTASITNDTSGGGFRVSDVRSYELVTSYTAGGDPSDLSGQKKPAKPVKTTSWQPLGKSDGITPLAVNAGQTVGVQVLFVAPTQSTQTARTATLLVKGDTFAQASIPLTALVGGISINVPAIAVGQSRTQTFTIGVTLAAGPPTTVALNLDASSFKYGSASLAPTSVNVSQGVTGSATLTLSANSGAPLGAYPLILHWTAFNGPSTALDFSANVVAAGLRASPIQQKYLSLNGPSGFLGTATASESLCDDKLGQFQTFQHGAIYWSGVDGSPAFEVHGPILTYIGGDQNPANACSTYEALGYPTSDVVTPLPSVLKSHFQRGGVYSKATTGTHSVYEGFFPVYSQFGEESGVLGLPLASSGPVFQDFENGALYQPAQMPAEQLIAATINTDVFPPSYVLDQVNQEIAKVVSSQNAQAQKTGDYQVSIQGGASLQSPAVADYSVVGGITQNRQIRIQQDFFVSIPVISNPTAHLAFNLLLQPASNSISATLTNVAVTSSNQTLHDKLLAAIPKGPISLPAPGSVGSTSILSLKILTTGTGVGVTDLKFQDLGIGSVAALIAPIL